MARPSEYSPVIIPAVKAAAHFGATRAEIADYLGVTRGCFAKWALEHEELNNVLKIGASSADRRVVDSLYSRAIAGDVTACIFWLKNRLPHEWRDVQHLDQAVGMYILSDTPMSEEQWIRERTRTIEAKANTGSNNVATTLSPDDDDTAKPLE